MPGIVLVAWLNQALDYMVTSPDYKAVAANKTHIKKEERRRPVLVKFRTKYIREDNTHSNTLSYS